MNNQSDDQSQQLDFNLKLSELAMPDLRLQVEDMLKKVKAQKLRIEQKTKQIVLQNGGR